MFNLGRNHLRTMIHDSLWFFASVILAPTTSKIDSIMSAKTENSV